jgi:hypothetical protein
MAEKVRGINWNKVAFLMEQLQREMAGDPEFAEEAKWLAANLKIVRRIAKLPPTEQRKRFERAKRNPSWVAHIHDLDVGTHHPAGLKVVK